MFREVNLEVSMKAFFETAPEMIQKNVETIFDAWRELLRDRQRISILFWAADGSHILDYTGDLDEEIAWCSFAGAANKPLLADGADRDVDLHSTCIPYRDNLPKVTHRTLKNIAEALKNEGKRRYPESEIWVGIPFDIGPEFAKSDFKYHRHKEICTGEGEGGKTFLNSYGLLCADSYPYAGYPDGLPEGIPFGSFLGRQTQIYLSDLGFDYLWLSNGVGFSATSWLATGKVFDGKEFHEKKREEVQEKVFGFWTHFRKECPDYPVYTRGTNFSAGIDYAADAVSLYRIYHADLKIVPPPNSPWAAINGNYGLELMGHLSRNCELPGKEFMFRFYLHDPWWINSPWYDRYNRSAHDIYLPMALSRIDEEGKVHGAEILNVFTLDNTFGEMPACCVRELIPHLMQAEKDSPDAPSPFVWIYPFQEYTTASGEETLRKILSGDLFISRAIANGFPLSSIVSADFLEQHDWELYGKSILVSPVPTAGSMYEKILLSYVDEGGKVLFYGSLNQAGKAFLKTFQLEKRKMEEETVSVECPVSLDENRDGISPGHVLLRKSLCGGVVGQKDGKTILWKKYRNAVWYQAPAELSSLDYDPHSERDVDSPREVQWGSVILRNILKEFGYHIAFSKPTAETKIPVIMINKSNNATIFSVYTPDQTVETKLKFPLGAPIFDCFSVELKEGCAAYRFDRCTHRECRVYVEQESGVVSVREEPPVSMKYRRRITVSGLCNATVRFFGEAYCKTEITAVKNAMPDRYYTEEPFDGGIVESGEYGTYYEARNITGSMTFSMPYPETLLYSQ